MNKWLFRKARELVTFRTGKLDSNAAEEGGIYPFFTCSQETYRINNFAFDTECVLLAGNNATGVFPLKYFKGQFNAYQRTYVIEPIDSNILDIRYFYFFLRPYLEAFKQQATGATTKFLTITILNNIDVALPSIGTQRKIASILSAYDDLIENNKRRIAILEKMAEEIYREWFVRMRFPSYAKATEDKPARRTNKGLPVGWIESRLGEEVTFTMGQSPKSEHYNTNGDGLPFNQGVGTYGVRFPKKEIYCSSTGRKAKTGDILFSVRAPVGRLNIADSEMIIGRGLAAIRHKKNFNSYLYYLLKVAFSNEDIIGNGSIFNSVGKDELARFPILQPPEPLVVKFNELASNIDKEIELLIRTNDNLMQTRDLLLPRLISGKLSVENLELPSNEKLAPVNTSEPEQELAHA